MGYIYCENEVTEVAKKTCTATKKNKFFEWKLLIG